MTIDTLSLGDDFSLDAYLATAKRWLEAAFAGRSLRAPVPTSLHEAMA